MKKKIFHFLATVVFVLALTGCGDSKGPSEEDGIQMAAEDMMVLAVEELEGKDNSLDPYSAVAHIPAGAGDKGLRGSRFLGETRIYFLNRYIEEKWGEIRYVGENGETGAERFDWSRSWNDQPWAASAVAGSDHFLILRREISEGENERTFFAEMDENCQKIREIDIPESADEISSFLMDSSGRLYLMLSEPDGFLCRVYSDQGELLAESALPPDAYFNGFTLLYDGRVAYTVVTKQNGASLQYLDPKTDTAQILAEVPQPERGEATGFRTLLDGDTMLYEEFDGLYRSGLSGQDPEPVYLWANHGIYMPAVYDIRVDSEGRIRVLYETEDDYECLCLEPTGEEVPIREITAAVSSVNEQKWERLATAFEKKYPSCHITLVDGYTYGDTSLLTELTAGYGPVLIDTALIGFEEQEKLWQPLDSVMEQLGITEDLVTSAMEMGKIDGTLYGIVTDFSLQTLLTPTSDQQDWDYRAFLQAVEERPELETVSNVYGEGGGLAFFVNYLSHGLDDTLLWNAQDGTTNFDSEDFRRALAIAKKYFEKAEQTDSDATIFNGKMLCNEVTIRRPEDVALYRIMYGEKACFTGYPSADGADFFVQGRDPMALRRNATMDEKALALAFMKFSLSYEGQALAAKDINFCLSVRKDVLEEQIEGMNGNQILTLPGGESVSLEDHLDIEKDRETLLELVEKARAHRYFPWELRDILFEELEQYYDGSITEEMLISHLESRVGLYLEERR